MIQSDTDVWKECSFSMNVQFVSGVIADCSPGLTVSHLSFLSLCRAEGAVGKGRGNAAVPADDPRPEGEVASSSAGLGQKQRHCLAAGPCRQRAHMGLPHGLHCAANEQAKVLQFSTFYKYRTMIWDYWIYVH